MDTDSFVLSFTPLHGLFNYLKKLSKNIDLSETNPSHEVFSKVNINVRNLNEKENQNKSGKMKPELSPDFELPEVDFVGVNFT